MTYLNNAARRLMLDQHGIVSVEQLAGVGITESQLRNLECHGDLVSIIKGAYRSPLVPLTEFGRCAAICLTRPDAAISGPTAGRLWGLRRMPPDHRIHVILPPRSRQPAAKWVTVYRTAAIRPDDMIRRNDGIAITSMARTVLDLSRVPSDLDLLSVAEQAKHDGALTDVEMRNVAVDFQSPRRPWLDRYLRVLSRSLSGGGAESHPEVRVGDALRRRGLRSLVRQHEVELTSGRRVRFDLAVPGRRIAIEIDVFPTHESTIGFADDERRDAEAEHDHWTILRVTRESFENDFDRTIDWLLRVCQTLSPSHR